MQNKQNAPSRSARRAKPANRSIRTDLATEARDFAPETLGVAHERRLGEGVTVTRVVVETEAAAQALGKRRGEYVTLDAPKLAKRDADAARRVEEAIGKAIREMLAKKGVSLEASVMVVGLGNRAVTPDSLGPKAIEKVFVTRHLMDFLPEETRGRMRPVSAFAPGVLGITGVESDEMVKGLMQRIKPGAVIAVDALASREPMRIGTTFQLTDTGIHPGGGIGANSAVLDEEALGVPVLALGVPLVVYASTLSRDAVAMVLQEAAKADSLGGLDSYGYRDSLGNMDSYGHSDSFGDVNSYGNDDGFDDIDSYGNDDGFDDIDSYENDNSLDDKDGYGDTESFGGMDSLGNSDILDLVDELVCEKMGDMMVTPKEIDAIVLDCAAIAARGINFALHALHPSEIEEIML